MKQIPRYDPAVTDPLAIKAALSQLFNTTLTDMWMTCTQRDRIVIGSHNLECTGAIKESRYREPKTGRYDGTHLLGNSGQKFYTLSVLAILRSAELTSLEYEFYQSCPEFGYQNRQHRRTGTRQTHRSQKSDNRKPFSLPTSNRFESFYISTQGN